MPLALVTNDDGITSFFLRALVEALQERFDVVVAAPKREQSWIGRAMSRHSDVTVERCPDLPCDGWCIDGTPSDCVNVALDHLLSSPPDIVVSGINIGFNTTIPLILCSGTVAGAIEGAVWGHRAVAVSQVVPSEHFDLVRSNNAKVPEPIAQQVRLSARHASEFCENLLDAPAQRLVVHNLNYPMPMKLDAPLVQTVPSDAVLGGLFGKTQSEDGTYRFQYRFGQMLQSEHTTDRAALAQGSISHSILDFSKIGVLGGA